jgi:hypothetical protein
MGEFCRCLGSGLGKHCLHPGSMGLAGPTGRRDRTRNCVLLLHRLCNAPDRRRATKKLVLGNAARVRCAGKNGSGGRHQDREEGCIIGWNERRRTKRLSTVEGSKISIRLRRQDRDGGRSFDHFLARLASQPLFFHATLPREVTQLPAQHRTASQNCNTELQHRTYNTPETYGAK